jgi:CobQ-like glutamine amidotransferase family enzyme
VKRIRLLHLYPRHLNIYADRGNLMVLSQRCTARGIELEVHELQLGEHFQWDAVDLFYVGGGQDRDQARVAEEFAGAVGAAIAAAVDSDAALLAVCGGYQLLGHGYTAHDGSRMQGLGVFDADTVAGDTRLIGNVAIEATLPAIADQPEQHFVVAGFENHAGRTTLAQGQAPLGRVIAGHGNDGRSGWEGAIVRSAIGTYLHGPLLPRNPQLADWLIRAALEHAEVGSGHGLAALDDTLAAQARDVSLARARAES